MSSPLRIIHVALAILVSMALAIGTLEVGLRALGLGPPSVNTEFDPALGWRGQPGSKVRRTSKEFDVSLKLDGQGLRDDFKSREDLEKKRGTFRVLLLGDSFVSGYTVAREDLFVDLLEDAYRREGRPIEVVNAGVQGYSTDQQLVWLEAHGRDFDPDLVLALPYENDIWWNASPDYLGEAKPLFDEDGVLTAASLPEPPPKPWWASFAIGRLPRLFRSLPTLEVDGVKMPVEMTSRLAAPPPETLAAEARTRLLIQRMEAASRRIGASRFAVSPIASEAQVSASDQAGSAPKTDAGTLDPGRPYRLFEQAAEAAGAPVVATLPALRQATKKGEDLYYGRDFHLNPRGNAVLARALYDGLDAWNFVPPLASDRRASPPDPDRDTRRGPWPTWPLWYLGLTISLGTLFSRLYPSVEPQRAYLQVGALFAVIFGVALLGAGLIAALPPLAARIAPIGLVLGMLSFIAFKLGDRAGTILELLRSFTLRGHWYLLPLLTVLLSVGTLLVVAASSPLIAPFIYTLF